MFIWLSLIAAMLFFISDRKVRLAILPGLAILVTLCYSLSWKLVYGINTHVKLSTVRPRGYQFLVSYIISASALTIILATITAFIFLLLGRLISKPVFKASGENGRNEKAARILYLIASIITSAAGLCQVCFAFTYSRIKASTVEMLEKMTIAFGRLGNTRQTTIIYGLIFLSIGVICLILVLTCRKIYKKLSAAETPKKNTVLTLGIIISAAGNLGIWIIAAVGLIMWRKIFFFNGYAYTKVLCLICMLLMAAGLILILIGFAKTNAKKSVIKTVFAIILIIASECDLLWLYVNATEKLLGIIVF